MKFDELFEPKEITRPDVPTPEMWLKLNSQLLWVKTTIDPDFKVNIKESVKHQLIQQLAAHLLMNDLVQFKEGYIFPSGRQEIIGHIRVVTKEEKV